VRVLAFDTALGACSAAIWADGVVLARAFEPRSRGHAEALLPMIETVLNEAGLRLDALNRLAVTVGPGSFAGTRVGLAAARGLALATGLPLVGITTLEAVAFDLPADAGSAIVSAFDAYRGELYIQIFDPDLRQRTPPAALPPEAAADLVDRAEAVLAGNAAARLAPALTARGIACTVAEGREQPDAALVAALAARRQPDATPPAPLYLRPPDAKLPAAKTTPA
jgi:tRNA threonylcarbamoyladenosine biosynthesis protein TsaB